MKIKWSLAVLSTGLALVLTAAVVKSAAPSDALGSRTSGGTCMESGLAEFAFTGRGLPTRGHGAGTFTGNQSLCQMSDPSIHSGTESGSFTIDFNCATLSGSDSGVDTIVWDNGRTTVATFSETVVAGGLYNGVSSIGA